MTAGRSTGGGWSAGGLPDSGTIYRAGGKGGPDKPDFSLHGTTMGLEFEAIWTRPPTMLATIA